MLEILKKKTEFFSSHERSLMSKNLKGKEVFQMPAARMLFETTCFGIACL